MDNLTPITREEILMNDEPLTPITREEKILAGEDLNPVTRREYFLKKYRHAGGDVMVEGLSVTANGTYTAPEGKAYSPVEVNVPMPENAYLLKTASGSLVSFDDGADLPMPSFVCNITAQQDLHGYDSPWVGGAGKNKLPMPVDGIKAANTNGTWSGNSYAINGVTFTVLTDSDGNVTGIKANNKAENGNAIFYVTRIIDEVPYKNGESYIINGCPQGGTSSTYSCYLYQTIEGGGANHADDMGSGATITSQSTTNPFRDYIIVIHNGYTANNITFYPMIRLATETDPTFAPYSNICPISGHTGVDAWVRGKNLFEPYAESKKINASGEIVNSDNTNVGKAFVKDGVTYTISLSHDNTVTDTITERYAFYDVSNNILETGSMSYKPSTTPNPYKEIIAPPNAAILYMDYRKVTTNQQIEIGETASTYTPYNPNSQNISVSWQTEAGEVYGGYVDLVSGVLTVDKAGVDMGSLTWIKDSSANNSRYVAQRSGIKSNSTIISDIFKPATYSDVYYHRVDEAIVTHDTYAQIVIHSSTFEAEYDADGFKTQMSGHYAVYELATPITYQLTPQQIKSLLGNNNAWCSTGDVDIDYFAKEV